jgi:hypothetical protein
MDEVGGGEKTDGHRIDMAAMRAVMQGPSPSNCILLNFTPWIFSIMVVAT